MPAPARSRSDLYGSLAFATVVLASFVQFPVASRITGEPWQLVVVFVLGAIYSLFGILCDDLFLRYGPRGATFYFGLQCAIVIAMMALSPVRGYFHIIELPIASQAILELRPRWAATVVLGLFAACIGAFIKAYGTAIIPQAVLGYGAAFAFTTVFTIITREALRAKKRAEQLSDELAAANEKLRTAALQTEELAVTSERNRLAREIHDGLGHYLTVINVQLEAARAILESDSARATRSIENALRLSREALDDVRRSVGSLRHDTTRPPLPEALRQLANDAGLPATLKIEGTPRTLLPTLEHALFRSAQEGLTNVCKHAGARRCELRLDFREPTRVLLSVVDDGGGAHPNGTSSGHGLRGLRERIELLGGRVATTNRAEGGFALTVEVPA